MPPGGTLTVTAVFPAPPEETTELAVLIDGMLPVQVPVQPAGPTLVDDPVLRASSEGEPKVGWSLPRRRACGRRRDEEDGDPAARRLLFAFGSAELARPRSRPSPRSTTRSGPAAPAR